MLLAGCAAPPPSAVGTCLLPAEHPAVVALLFFGRDIAGRAPLGNSEWAEFAAQTIAANFPDGFTVVDGEGRWRDPRTGDVALEQSKILLVVAPQSAGLGRRLTAVIDAYRTRFRQRSVGIITGAACAAFAERRANNAPR